MTQQEIYNSQRKMIFAIVFLFLFMASIPFIARLVVKGEISLEGLITIAFISIIGYLLLNGKNWARYVLSILALLIALQSIGQVLASTKSNGFVYSILMTIFFTAISIYLYRSEQLSNFITLSKLGYKSNDNSEKMNEDIPTQRIHKISIHSFKEEVNYINLLKEMISNIDLLKGSEIDTNKDKNGDLFYEIKKDDLVYELTLNNYLAVFDRSLISELNAVLLDIGDKRSFVLLHKEGVTQTNKSDYIEIALVNSTEKISLIQRGLIKK